MRYLQLSQISMKQMPLFFSLIVSLLLTACNDNSFLSSVSLGSDFSVNSAESIELIVQTDIPDSSIISYQWIQKSGIAVLFNEQNRESITFTAPELNADNDSLVFEVIVTDDQGVAYSDTIIITVLVSESRLTTVNISWMPPSLNEDSSQLIDLSGFKIYYGESSDNLDKVVTVSDPLQSSRKIEGLSANRVYFFAVTAFNDSGFESQYSQMVQIQV